MLYKDDSQETGFLILPDMKWDLTNISTLYLVALSLNRRIRSLRDLNKCHLPMLKNIRREATRVVKERWGLEKGSLRFYVHYQPSYCEWPLSLPDSALTAIFFSRPLSCPHCQLKLCRTTWDEHWPSTSFG